MDKEINNNGYEYVDLGLPSGTLWATMNVGANKPSNYGKYFQWGDIVGYAKKQIGNGSKKKAFSAYLNDYKFGVNGSSSIFSKYTTKGETLELEDDAAHVNMGGSWHMPSPDQIRELIDNTTSEWTSLDGVNGRLFTSKKDGSESIFIPAAGYAWDGSDQGSGDDGGVWSSMLSTDYVSYGQYLYFSSGYVVLYSSHRCNGLSVRGVIDSNRNSSKEKEGKLTENPTFEEMLENEIRRILRRE